MSSNNLYTLYMRDVQDLAETLVIKSELTAERINEYLVIHGGADAVDEFELSSWKYYLNLSGVYHESDTRMIITSIDTMESIEFNKANLVLHVATNTAYRYGTRQYKELVGRYPGQERLILGILYPVDLDAAIVAPDNALLGWPTHLIESNEYSLPKNIAGWINRFQSRWDNNQYNITDELYKATQLGVMYINLVPAILNLRLAACKTNEAHSFHVFHYLASHGFNEYFFQFFTPKQALFFYRNISYIEHNSGSRDNFSWLIDEVMTERKLPLATFLMSHDLTLMKETGIESLRPEVSFIRESLNMPTQQLSAKTRDLRTMLIKEDPLARDNEAIRDTTAPVMREDIIYSKKNSLPTKMLESYVVDYSNSAVYPFEWIMLNHWIYLAPLGLTGNFIAISNPKNGERISLNNLDALLLYFYAYFASLNVFLEVPPSLVAHRVSRIVKPTLDEIVEKLDTKVFSAERAEVIRVRQPHVYGMTSSQAFYDFGQSVYLSQDWQVKYVANIDDRMATAYAQNTVNAMYSDSLVDLNLGFGTTYDAWIGARGLSLEDFTAEDFVTLYTSIFINVTGIDRNQRVSTRNIQRAMIDVMKQLSSYAVQYITDITDSNIVFGNFAGVRFDGIKHEAIGLTYCDTPAIDVSNQRNETIDENTLNTAVVIEHLGGVVVGMVSMPVQVDLNTNGQYYTETLHDLGGIAFTADATPSTDPDVITVPGVEETYNILTQAQRLLLKNAYDARRKGDENLYGIFLARTSYASSFEPLGISNRMLSSNNLNPADVISRSPERFKARIESLNAYPWASLGETSVMIAARELPHADAAMVYGPFNETVNPWNPATLNTPALNALTLSGADLAMLSKIVLSPTY